MITAQFLVNIILIVIIAALLKVLWDQQTEIHTLSGRHSKVSPNKIKRSQSHVITSVWCHQGNNKMCQFKNLCYNSEQEEFVMFLDKSSVLENVQLTDGSLILDMSSVRDHNTMQATIIALPRKYSTQFHMDWVEVSTLIFKRFLPDNLMHMFHDDILPLYDSLKYLTFGFNRNKTDPFKMQLVVFNDTEEELDVETDSFYKMLSVFPIKNKQDLKIGKQLTCFKDITVGLSTRTTWYDFGFVSHQGPLSETKLTNYYVNDVVDFFEYNLKFSMENNHEDFIVLLTRKETRRILNELELSVAIANTARIKVVNLSLDTHSLFEIISYVRRCKGIIGMHGSLLILSLFLKTDSFLIELFPYAINSNSYTPYKTLFKIRDMDSLYKAWTNKEKGNSFGHSDWPPERGGINHLEEQERQTILFQKEVPQHVCCSDPSWLYHIYQDTKVDVEEVASFVQSSLEKINRIQTEKRRFKDSFTDFYPSKVKGASCYTSHLDANLHHRSDLQSYLHITFAPPWTLNFVEEKNDTEYEILIQNIYYEQPTVLKHKTNLTSVKIKVDNKGTYVIWVRCLIDHVNYGPYSDSTYCV